MANDKRLIDASAVLATQFTTGLSDASGNYYGYADVVFASDIENAPTVDAVEVVHGQWVRKKEWHLGRWVAWLECSCCGERDDNCEMYDMLPFGAEPSNYCPNCGARMDLEVSND